MPATLAPNVSIVQNNPPSCTNYVNGDLGVSTSTGNPPFIYAWSDPNSQTTQVATGLDNIAYTVTVTDVNGCESTRSEEHTSELQSP